MSFFSDITSSLRVADIKNAWKIFGRNVRKKHIVLLGAELKEKICGCLINNDHFNTEVYLNVASTDVTNDTTRSSHNDIRTFEQKWLLCCDETFARRTSSVLYR